MKAFIAEVLPPERTGLRPPVQHWVVLEETEELAMDALTHVVPRGSEVLMTGDKLDEEEAKREGLEPGVPRALTSRSDQAPPTAPESESFMRRA
jgi:hypothetical protein